jgi:hypothetical protein
MEEIFLIQEKNIFFQEVGKMQTNEAKSYSAGSFQPVVDKCDGCDRIVEENSTNYCKTYVNPAAKWRLGICNFATHAKPEITVVKVRINPLKAAKRASSSRRG